MKKILLILYAIIFIAGVTNAQTKGTVVGKGTVLTDSIGYSESGADSLLIVKIGLSKEWINIMIANNDNDPVDSIAVYPGTIIFNEAKNPTDTLWGNLSPVIDSTGEKVNVMINQAATTSVTANSYWLWSPVIDLLKFEYLNARANLPARSTTISVQTFK